MKTRSIKLNAILNGIKQACSVLFPLITIPYVSRILGNETYGKINFGSSMVSYFSLLAALGISAYAIREGAKVREDKESFQTFANEVFTINIITTVISYLLLGIVLVFWAKVQDYRLLIIIQSSFIIFTTLGIDWTNTIYEDFFYTTVRYIIVQFLSLILMFIFVRSPKDYLIYAGITAFAHIGGDLVNIFYIRRHYVRVRLTTKPRLKKHIVPMLYLFCNNLAATIYVSSDITLLTLLKNDMVTGIYSIASNIYNVVKMFINALIGVALPRLSVYSGNNDREQYDNLFNQMFHAILILILPGTVGLFMLSKDIINIIAGANYISGYISLRILSVALSFAVLSYMFVYSVMIVNKMEKYCLISTLISAVVNVALNFIFIPWLSLNGAAITTVISEIIVLSLSLYFSRGKYNIKLNLRKLLPCIVGCIGIIGICILVQHLIFNSLLVVITSFILSALFYAAIMIGLKDEIVRGAFDNFFKR